MKISLRKKALRRHAFFAPVPAILARVLFAVFLSGAGSALTQSLSLQTDTPLIADQPPAPDSIVQLTADAYGLPRLTPDQATNSGYFCFWWVTPGGAALPMPIPPQDFSAMPVFLIAPGQFLVDATGGQVAVNPRLSRLQAAGRAVPSALESMANAVVNLVLTTRS